MSPAWSGCAERARRRDDPMIGSAPYALGWLLIEHPGPWPREALNSPGIGPPIRRELVTLSRETPTRVLLIRRPGRQAPSPERRWYAVGPRHTCRGSWTEGHQLADAVAAMRALLAEPGVPAGRVPAEDSAIVLVCTHGNHDTCCAVLGRPVANALATRWPDLVWECSHLGGDRFAPNVVMLPDATYYGSLDSDTALEVVARHLGGTLDVDHLRGVARQDPIAQAAIAELHRRRGPWAPTAVTADAPVGLGAHHWRVRLSGTEGNWTAVVTAHRQEPAVLTCQASGPTPATTYRVDALEPDS